MTSGIYKITNTVNQKVYIGSAVDLKRRKKQHFSGRQTNKILKQAIKKYGVENFKFEVLEECNPDHCVAVEQTFIDYYKRLLGWENLYNLSPTAGNCLGVKHSKETRKKVSNATRGNKNPNFGKQHTEATKQKISDAKRGKCVGDKNHNFGKPMSEEQKQKISDAKKGKQLSEEHKRKVGDALKGDKNPRYDSTIYLFQHADGRQFQGTQHQLRTKEGLDQGTLSNVILGRYKSTGGWMLSYAPILPPETS
jgi:group I intron endonuclease